MDWAEYLSSTGGGLPCKDTPTRLHLLDWRELFGCRDRLRRKQPGIAEAGGALHMVAQGYLPVDALRERLSALRGENAH